jgi:signal transduction histidine kinase
MGSEALFHDLYLASGLKRYSASLLVLAVALGIRALLDPSWVSHTPYVTVFAATIFASWYGGIWPGILIAVLGVLASNLFFVDPLYSLRPYSRPEVLVSSILYIATCVPIIAIGEANRRSTQRRCEAQDLLLQCNSDLETRVRQRTAELETSNQGLRRLSSRLMHLQDEERRKFSRELHDSLGQILVMAKLNLSKLFQQNPHDKLLAETEKLLEEALVETRTISYLLHPPLLDETGLVSAAKWYVKGFAQRSGIQVSIEVGHDFARLPRSTELALFRILQESLTNIYKYANASRAEVFLGSQSSDVLLQVRDYGKGIPPETLESLQCQGADMGVGLAGMRERVNEQGGRFEIHSDDTGTLISVTMPTDERNPC